MRTETYKYKSKGFAIVLGLFLGAMGIHRFYLGHTAVGFAFIVCFVFSFISPYFWVPALVAILDVIFIATKKP